MKKFVSLIMVFVCMLSVCLTFTNCGGAADKAADEVAGNVASNVYYVANADFFYSDDLGHSYGNGTKEYNVGETVYMKVTARVDSNKEIPEPINVKLTIPNITAVSATYFDGQPITPKVDIVQNVTVYEYTVPTNLPEKSNAGDCVFQFVPNSEARVTMTLEFDDKVDAMYDRVNTVLFVAPENTDSDGE